MNTVSGGPTQSLGFNYGGVSAPDYQSWLKQYNAANPNAGKQQANVSPYGGGRQAQAGNPPSPFLGQGSNNNSFPGMASGGYGSQPQSNYVPYGGQQSGGGYGGGGQGGGYGNSPPGGGQTSSGIATITSAFGDPVLPFAGGAQQQQSINRGVDQAFGGPSLAQMAMGVRRDNSGLLPTAGDMTAVNPAIAQRATNAAMAQVGIPYQQNLANANALLNWQAGQGADVLGQAQNLAGINEGQQNYGLGQQLGNMDLNYGQAANKADLIQSLFGGLFGGNGGGGLMGGISGLLGGF